MNKVIALPQFAPLSMPMVCYLLGITHEALLADLLFPATSRFFTRLGTLETQVAAKRDLLLSRMSTQNDLSVNWFRSSVTPTKKLSHKGMLSLQTVKNLRERNIFRFHGWGQPDVDSAASIIISSWVTADEAFHEITESNLSSFVPSSQQENEPIFWCFSETPPSPLGQRSPITPCPWPSLPVGLPVGTLLYSRWSVYDPSWLQFPGLGAVRFSSIDEHALEYWDGSIKSYDVRRLLETIRQNVKDDEAFQTLRSRTLQSFAQSVLQKLALSRLTSTPSVTEYPLVWDRKNIWPNEIYSL